MYLIHARAPVGRLEDADPADGGQLVVVASLRSASTQGGALPRPREDPPRCPASAQCVCRRRRAAAGHKSLPESCPRQPAQDGRAPRRELVCPDGLAGVVCRARRPEPLADSVW